MLVCPKCGSDEGFRTKEIVSYEQLYNFNGDPDGTTEYQAVKGGKLKYCGNCQKDITKFVNGNVEGFSI